MTVSAVYSLNNHIRVNARETLIKIMNIKGLWIMIIHLICIHEWRLLKGLRGCIIIYIVAACARKKASFAIVSNLQKEIG